MDSTAPRAPGCLITNKDTGIIIASKFASSNSKVRF